MAHVQLRGPLKTRTGGIAAHEVQGTTVTEVLRGLEALHPTAAGWILDERGVLRRHINVFVNGEHAGQDTTVGASDRVEVLPAISGG
jgi:molybdopterin converting factor small subunit